MAQAPSDEEVGRQILGVFFRNKIRAGGTLRRNHFIEVRDADFQRGINKAVENNWIKIKMRDRYTYELTDAVNSILNPACLHGDFSPVICDFRCYSNSGQILQRSEMTLSANSGHRAIQPETPKPRRPWSRTNQ
jgi:hypothetical protein